MKYTQRLCPVLLVYRRRSRNAVLDDFNAEMVAERAHTHLNEIIRTILTAYQQYASTLA